MQNRFIQYAGLFVGALLAWCRVGSAATGAAALDLRPAIRPGGLPADSCEHATNVHRDEHNDELQPTASGGDCELILSTAVEFKCVLSDRLCPQSDFKAAHVLAFLERLDSGPPR